MLLKVTILILIDGFLQFWNLNFGILKKESHNPYFNRWFSAIIMSDGKKEEIYSVTILILIDGFLQLRKAPINELYKACHNPYFNRWFSAIK